MLKEKETVLRRFLIFVDSLRHRPGLSVRLPPARAAQRSDHHPLRSSALALVIAVPYWCLTLYANGMYLSMRTRSYLEILWAVIKSAVVTFLLLGTFIFLFKLTFMSRLFFVLFSGLSFLFIWLEKTAIFMSSHYVRRQGLNTRRLLIVGTGKRAVEFVKKDRPAIRSGASSSSGPSTTSPAAASTRSAGCTSSGRSTTSPRSSTRTPSTRSSSSCPGPA